MAADNTTLGVENITHSGNSTGLDQQFLQEKLSEVYLGNVAGSVELGSMLFLSLIGYSLFRADVSGDISAAVLIPLTFVLASEGFLPFGDGLVYGMILAVSGVFIFGVIKYADR